MSTLRLIQLEQSLPFMIYRPTLSLESRSRNHSPNMNRSRDYLTKTAPKSVGAIGTYCSAIFRNSTGK